MTQNLLHLLTLVLLLFSSSHSLFAYDFSSVNDDSITIYYNKLSDTECEVTRNNGIGYSGSITIPASVSYAGDTYSVSSIGKSAFYDCCLTSIFLPNSLTSIGDSAFCFCEYLSSIALPNTLTSIGKSVFAICSSLTSIALPNSLTSIGDDAFYHCASLTSITLPYSLTSIGNAAFASCSSLTSFSIDPFNPNFSSLDGILFNKNQSLLICCPGGKQGSYIVPNTVTSIGNSAFSGCVFLTSIALPNSIASIGDHVFHGCKSLTSITVAPSNSNFSSLDSILFNKDQSLLICCPGGKQGSYIIPSTVTSIGSGAFWSCESLTSISLPNSLTSIGDLAFYSCTSLTSISLPNSLATIGDHAFSFCSGLTSVNILATTPPSVGYMAFSYVPLYSAILYVPVGALSLYAAATGWQDFGSIIQFDPSYFGVTNQDGVTIYYSKFNDTECEVTYSYSRYSGSIIIPASVTYAGSTFSVTKIGQSAFQDCTSLTSISLPNSITGIGYRAFCCCTSLASVSLPDSLSYIDDEAFCCCTSLTSISLPNSLTYIDEDVFCGCTSLTSISLPNSLICTELGAFRGCTSLTSNTLPNSLTSVGSCTFQDCM